MTRNFFSWHKHIFQGEIFSTHSVLWLDDGLLAALDVLGVHEDELRDLSVLLTDQLQSLLLYPGGAEIVTLLCLQ